MRTVSSLDSQWPEVVGPISQAIDLETTARSSDALNRRRELRNGAQLLQLALAYGPGGLSLGSAAAWAGISEGASLSDTAVMKRVRGAADWLGAIAGVPSRGGAGGKHGSAGRATSAHRRQQCRHPFRQHRRGLAAARALRPGGRGFTELDLTDGRGAERFGRTALAAGEVVVGDRGNARPLDLLAVTQAGVDFIERVAWAPLRLHGAHGAPLAWEPIFDSLAPHEVTERQVRVDRAGPGGQGRSTALVAAHLVVLRLSQCAAPRAAKVVRRRHSRQNTHARCSGRSWAPTFSGSELYVCGLGQVWQCAVAPCRHATHDTLAEAALPADGARAGSKA